MPHSDQPSLDRIIIALLLAVVALSLPIIWWSPKYEAGYYAALAGLVTTLSNACGAKFGLSQAARQPSLEHPPVLPVEPPRPTT